MRRSQGQVAVGSVRHIKVRCAAGCLGPCSGSAAVVQWVQASHALPALRAARACAAASARRGSAAPAHPPPPAPDALAQVVEKVTGKLLMTAVADPSERVRRTVLQALAASAALDDHLAQVCAGACGCLAAAAAAGAAPPLHPHPAGQPPQRPPPSPCPAHPTTTHACFAPAFAPAACQEPRAHLTISPPPGPGPRPPPQADCLRALFVALNDESFAIRAISIGLVGRLAQRNPAYVNPALRRHLLQLLTDMECSPDSRCAAAGATRARRLAAGGDRGWAARSGPQSQARPHARSAAQRSQTPPAAPWARPCRSPPRMQPGGASSPRSPGTACSAPPPPLGLHTHLPPPHTPPHTRTHAGTARRARRCWTA
jgi:hypothetical protein